MNKNIFLALALLASLAEAKPRNKPQFASHTILWQISDGLAEPESAQYDPKSQAVYISNVAGTPTEKDGRGWITKADVSGKVLGAQWVSQLNAPKGMRFHGNKLYVADIDELVEIDVKKDKVLRKIPVAGAKLLNDVEIGPWGNIYVSDTLGSRIYRVTPKGDAEVFAEGDALQSPNGLFIHKGKLYVAAWGLTTDWTTKTPGSLLSIDLKTKKIEPVTQPLGNLDGLERSPDGSWLVSDWVAGKIFKVSPKGQAKELLSGFQGSADLGYIRQRNMLIVPRMKENRVTAYLLAQPLPKNKK